ncbi:MAG: hypothetical protein JJU45_06990 [Acidimicrobiia bacterium]|nr:hypothetical protein [Acidimicrobiia bacterium]
MTKRGVTPRRQVRLVAAVARAQAIRQRRALLVAAVAGVVFAVLLVGLGSAASRVEQVVGARSFTVAVGGDQASASRFLEVLEEDRFRFRSEPDPEQAVIDQEALVGLVLPPGVDAALAGADPVELRLTYRRTEPRSVEAFTQLLVAVQEQELAMLAPDHPPALVTDVQSIIGDTELNRLTLARWLAAMAALLCLGVVSTTGAFFGSARERRSIEPLLALPLRRAALSSGVATGVLPVAAVQVGAGLAVVVASGLVPDATSNLPPDELAVVAVSVVLPSLVVVWLACCAGVLAGALGRGSDDAVSLGDVVGVPFMAVGVALFIGGDLAANAATAAVPVLGQALVVREVAAGVLEPVVIAVSLLSAAVTSAAILVVAARRLDDERSLLRATG